MGTQNRMAPKKAAKKSPAKKAAPEKTIKKKSPAAKKPAAKKTAKKTTAKKDAKEKKPRPPSAYNLFMKKELDKLKKSHPKLDHKERFKMAAGNWSKQKK